MTKNEKIKLCNKIDGEGGMDYAFIHYSDFPDIRDKRFHELRTAYKKAYEELSKYIGWDDFTSF